MMYDKIVILIWSKSFVKSKVKMSNETLYSYISYNSCTIKKYTIVK